jgi:hypothetical protein
MEIYRISIGEARTETEEAAMEVFRELRDQAGEETG